MITAGFIPRMALSNRDQEILAINQAMLESVVNGDWSRYAGFCAADLSCFEAETNGHLVEGLPFHEYYFNLPAGDTPATAVTVTMARPHLRWLCDDAVVISYTRLTQRLSGGEPITASCCETRIWQRRDHHWLQVHVHRS
jgi:calcium/calmodulin-dependent protein kinase (CaM kinase) II